MKSTGISTWVMGTLLLISLSSVAQAGGLDGKEVSTIAYGEASEVEAAIGE